VKGLQGREVDWWAVDFNEDFSAFHAETLREQAKYLHDVISYLRQIYGETSTVTVLAHSMGGIAARLMLQQEAHPVDSVRTLITLSSPHAYPPVAVDGALEQIYAEIQHPSLDEKVLLISLSGGILDNQLSSEGSVLSLARLWRTDTSLHAFTASMAALWSGVDHLAMMWCDQLRTRIARGVLRIEEDDSQGMNDRRQRWRRMLGITSSEDDQVPEFFFSAPFSAEKEEEILEETRWQADVPTSSDYASLEVITDARVGIDSSFGPPLDHDAEIRVDLCDAAQVCRTVSPAAFELLPPSTTKMDADAFPVAEVEYDLPGGSMRKLGIAMDFLIEKGITRIKIYTKAATNRAVYAGFVSSPTEHWTYQIPRPPMTFRANFPRRRSNNSPSEAVVIHGMHSTLFVYRLRIIPSSSTSALCDNRGLMPALQVTSLSTGDTQYYPALKADSIHKLMLHGVSPFMPASHNVSMQAFRFTLMMDTCQSIAGFEATIDLRASAGLLLSRYRTAIVAYPASAVLLASTVMWSNWDAGVAFSGTLATLISNSKALIPAIIAISWMGSAVQRIAYLIYGQSAYMPLINLTFGTPTLPFIYSALLAILFTLSSYGVAIAVTAGLEGSVVLFAILLRKMGKKSAFTTNESGSRFSSVAAILLALAICIAVIVAIPVQFVYLATFMVQWLSCVRFELLEGRDQQPWMSASKQARLLLHLMVWILPLNAPILLIWSRNLLQGWYGTLGRSDHNVLHVAGYLLATYIASTGQSIPRARSRASKTVTVLLALRCTLTALLYGIRYTYALGGSVNILLVWLSFLHFRDRLMQGTTSYTADEDATEDQEVEKRLLLAPLYSQRNRETSPAHYSNLPKTAADETSELTPPDSIRASTFVKDQQVSGYEIREKGNVQSTGVTEATTRLDALLEEYLTVLDRYMIARQSISDTVARGVFQLSKARMQLGMPHMHEGWDGRMQASTRVKVQPDGSFALVKVDLTREDDVVGQRKEGEAESGLRRRKKVDQSKMQEMVPQEDDGKVEKDEKSRQKQEARPYDPLYQFSALPPQSLRQSQISFEEVTRLIVGGDFADNNKREGLLGHMKRLDELEIRIREERSAR
jgi:pimeloyl-ACP methyl ester carboxylesterase